MSAPYFCYRLSEAVSRWMPQESAYSLARWISGGVRAASGEHEAVRENLRTVYGTGPTDAWLDGRVAEVYGHFSRYCVEMLYDASNGTLGKRVRLENPEALEKALAAGKGAILLSAHVGNWELAGMAIARRFPLWAVVQPHHDARIDRWFQTRRTQKGVRPIPTGMAFRKCLRALRANECVAVNGDRRFGEKGEPVRFFGRPALLPRGPLHMSRAAGSPIVATWAAPDGEGGWLVRFREPLFPEDYSEDREYHEVVAALIEDMIRPDPTYWFVFERFWKGALRP